ncbi:MAG: YjcQ family protein [Aerococcus sp.]|nr:YjcQ family protein [Aerococcus sp.]
MAKDDYDVIVFKLLVYFYACLKRVTVFKREEFELITTKAGVHEGYLLDILFMMQQEGLIEGLSFTRAWGREWILLGDVSEAKITANGIHYLKTNSQMKQVLNFLLDKADVIVSLIKLVSLTN